MADDRVSCYLIVCYTEDGDPVEGYRLLDEAGVREGIDGAVMPAAFTMRVLDMPRRRLDQLVDALEGTGATVREEPDRGPLIWRAEDV